MPFIAGIAQSVNRHVYQTMSGIQIALTANAQSQYQRDAEGFVVKLTRNASLGTSIVEAQ
jgi:hypothetical protein